MKLPYDYTPPSKADRDRWTRGPWDAESDCRASFDETKNVYWAVTRAGLGHLCGYIGVPKHHPWHGVQFDSGEDAPDGTYPSMHGGCTYAQYQPTNKLWWIGFDCAHLGDVSPGTLKHYEEAGATYKDMGFMMCELQQLIDQCPKAEVPQEYDVVESVMMGEGDAQGRG